jgi:hypothetical protein
VETVALDHDVCYIAKKTVQDSFDVSNVILLNDSEASKTCFDVQDYNA